MKRWCVRGCLPTDIDAGFSGQQERDRACRRSLGSADHDVEGASFGFQIAGQAADFVHRSAKGVLSNKVKLSAHPYAAVGPKGRDASASTDVTAIQELEECLLEFILKVPRSVQMEARTRTCMGKRFPQRTLC